jgi:dCTP deaminase
MTLVRLSSEATVSPKIDIKEDHISLVRLMSETSALSDTDIKKLVEENRLQIRELEYSAIGPASIDLRLGSTLIKYPPQTIAIGTDHPQGHEIDITGSSYKLCPGEFILGMTKERVSIPNGYLGVIETKGNIARAGIQVHSNDGHIDPGFSGNITLEIVNLHEEDVYIELVPDTFICQLFIGKLSSVNATTYKGKYLHQKKPTTYRP